jgi:enoyl-CoA hydratase/carnithine racemase
VRVERDGDRLRLTLARPQRRNAFDARTREELLAGLTVAAVDASVREVVLAGDGPTFCSGGDLDEFGTCADPVSAHLLRIGRSAGAVLASLGDRVVARVQGTCVGAGVELPAFAGRVVADPTTTFRLPEVAMGLVPGAGGTVSLPRRIGRHRTAWLALTGTAIDAPTALDWGLVDELSG